MVLSTIPNLPCLENSELHYSVSSPRPCHNPLPLLPYIIVKPKDVTSSKLAKLLKIGLHLLWSVPAEMLD